MRSSHELAGALPLAPRVRPQRAYASCCWRRSLAARGAAAAAAVRRPGAGAAEERSVRSARSSRCGHCRHRHFRAERRRARRVAVGAVRVRRQPLGPPAHAGRRVIVRASSWQAAAAHPRARGHPGHHAPVRRSRRRPRDPLAHAACSSSRPGRPHHPVAHVASRTRDPLPAWTSSPAESCSTPPTLSARCVFTARRSASPSFASGAPEHTAASAGAYSGPQSRAFGAVEGSAAGAGRLTSGPPGPCFTPSSSSSTGAARSSARRTSPTCSDANLEAREGLVTDVLPTASVVRSFAAQLGQLLAHHLLVWPPWSAAGARPPSS